MKAKIILHQTEIDNQQCHWAVVMIGKDFKDINNYEEVTTRSYRKKKQAQRRAEEICSVLGIIDGNISIGL